MISTLVVRVLNANMNLSPFCQIVNTFNEKSIH
jgi:hypothetical protein